MQFQKTWWHLKAYADISTAAIFLEQTIHNETLYAANNEHHFVEQFSDIDSSINPILCKLKMIIVEGGHTIQHYQSRDIMSSALRSMTNISYQHSRDFVILKDINNAFNTILHVYQRVHSSLWQWLFGFLYVFYGQ